MINQISTFTRITTPCLYFIGLATYWFYDNITGGNSFNYFALGVIIIFLVQMVKKSKALGLTLGVSGIILSFLMFLAVWSEYRHFNEITDNATHLMRVGSLLCSTTLVMSVLLTYNYAKMIKNSTGSF